MTQEQPARRTVADTAPGAGASGGAERNPRPRRRRGVRATAVAGAVAVAVALGIVVSQTISGGSGNGGDRGHGRAPGGLPATDVLAHPDQSPPRDLIAAGRTAVSAYFTGRTVRRANGDGAVTYAWSLLDTTSGRYRPTAWAWLDVAPGMRTAAVLERGLPVNRIGLLNLATHEVERWITVDRGVGGVRFSPDGTRLVATAYRLDPDGLFKDASRRVNDRTVPGPRPSRTGFHVIDVASGRADFTERPPRSQGRGFAGGGGRQDLHWSRDGALLWEPWDSAAGKVFYTVDGTEVPAPERQAALRRPGAALSPDGKHVTGKFAGDGGRIVSEVLDAGSGERAALVPGQQLLAWADDDALIAWSCDPERCDPGRGEFRNRLVLAGMDGGSPTPLSGFREGDLRHSGRWTPVFSRR
ncbi:WD40 repeat domain-containing protein [Streptomyces sp. NPDC001985]|uniref:hypothetical protein n=1 Tax=Streptomyces sp. NPDC001985 TaxID=3154406 RepID=UPI003326C712